MKRRLFLFAFFVLVLFSCNYENEQDKLSTGFEEKFKPDKDYLLDNSLKFKITEINDSRCPTDVDCIWAGKADVKIKVESPVSETFVLSTLDDKIDTVGNYSFELIDVSPYPVSTKQIKINEYKVTLNIKNLSN